MMQKPGYGAQFFRHTVVTVAVTLLCGVLAYLFRVLLFHRLSVEDYGLLFAVVSLSMLVRPFLSIGFDPGLAPVVTRLREDNNPEAIRNTALSVLVPQLAVALLLVVLAQHFARPIAVGCFGTERAAPVIRILAWATAVSPLFRTGYLLLLGMQFIVARNLVDLMKAVLTLGAALVLLHWGFGVRAAAYAYLASGLAASVLAAGALLYLAPALRSGRIGWRPASIPRVFQSGKYLSAAFGGVVLFAYTDTVMLSLLLTDYRAVAAYQIASPTLMIFYSLIVAAAANFMPMATTLWHKGQYALLSDGLALMYEAAFTLILPATVLAAAFSDILMRTLFMRDVLNAPQAFNILAVGSVFYFICHLNLQVLAAIDRPAHACRAIVIALAVNVALDALLIPPLGIRGAALATVAGHAVAAALMTRGIHRTLPLSFRVGHACAAVAGGCGLALLAAPARHSALAARHPIAAALAVCVIAYPALLALLEWLKLARLRELMRIMALRRLGAGESFESDP